MLDDPPFFKPYYDCPGCGTNAFLKNVGTRIRFHVVEVLSMWGSVVGGRALAEDLPWREADAFYFS